MKRFQPSTPFDLPETRLAGTCLIEAGAGTGKTYAITGLYLRLILEKGLTCDRILVVTFTEAATAELQERIRKRLKEAAEAFSSGTAEDPLLKKLLARFPEPGRTGCAEKLRVAVRDFDEAAIFTIHGFCRRMLLENAFESGSLFDTELVADQRPVVAEIVADFWRRAIFDASPRFAAYAESRNFTPEKLLSLFGPFLSHPDVKVIPEVSVPETKAAEERCSAAFSALSRRWLSEKGDIRELLSKEGLSRGRYKLDNIGVWIRRMDDFLKAGENQAELFEGFVKFTTEEICASVKKGCAPPAHPFFDLCGEAAEAHAALRDLYDRRLLGLKSELIRWGRNEMERRKENRNIRSFDDLLFSMRKALAGDRGRFLAEKIREKYGAALIDEFQDTDPVQYAIFHTLFGGADRLLFFIGDPKQAIYGFRGADVFAYLEAAARVDSRYTLRENWRSQPDLIAGVNAVFSGSELPFVYEGISFRPAVWPERETPVLTLDGRAEPALHLWYLLPPGSEGKPIPQQEARERIGASVAAEISRLLRLGGEGRALLGGKALRPADIAVLVRTNAEAQMVQKRLRDLRIPAVLSDTGDLFETAEALEMERLLQGIAQPYSGRMVRSALATDLLGVSGPELLRAGRDDADWEERLARFREYNRLWGSCGFIRMLKAVLREEAVLPRIMSFPDGERRSTNLLHLSEVLHRVWVERKPGMAGLVQWLSEQRNAEYRGSEEHLLRLESDADAVKLVTVHKSKGLEYPVVFCPFTWGGSRIRNGEAPLLFHDAEASPAPILDLGSEDRERHKGLAETELLSENLRLLYVALTRAKNRCYMVWGNFNLAETSAPAYLFHASRKDGEKTSGEVKGGNGRELRRDLEAVGSRAPGAILLSEMPERPGEPVAIPGPGGGKLVCRKFSGNLERAGRISSFSSLVAEAEEDAARFETETADFDAADPSGKESTVPSPASASDIFSFPRGAEAGVFFHDLMEHLDFDPENSQRVEGLVSEKLAAHGFDPSFKEAIRRMIRKVLSVPLLPERPDFTLSAIRTVDRLNELEFYFPLRKITPSGLKRIFSNFSRSGKSPRFPERLGRLAFSPASGFMRGFIDMVFRFEDRYYLVDWKSNHLGGSLEDYVEAPLSAAMNAHFYILQYHLYAVALDRYLRLRLPGYAYETHFGGVFYLFLRGIDPEEGAEYGIFRDRPAEKAIEAISAQLVRMPEPGGEASPGRLFS